MEERKPERKSSHLLSNRAFGLFAQILVVSGHLQVAKFVQHVLVCIRIELVTQMECKNAPAWSIGSPDQAGEIKLNGQCLTRGSDSGDQVKVSTILHQLLTHSHYGCLHVRAAWNPAACNMHAKRTRKHAHTYSCGLRCCWLQETSAPAVCALVLPSVDLRGAAVHRSVNVMAGQGSSGCSKASRVVGTKEPCLGEFLFMCCCRY